MIQVNDAAILKKNLWCDKIKHFLNSNRYEEQLLRKAFYVNAWLHVMLQNVLIYDMSETVLSNKMAPFRSSHLLSVSKTGRNICPNDIVF